MSRMSVEELSSKFWRWTAPHPAWSAGSPGSPGSQGWDEDVASVYSESDEAILLIDPTIVPTSAASPDERDRLLPHIGQDAERVGGQVVVLVLNESHGRSAQDFADRYSARVFASEAAAAKLECRVDEKMTADTALPGGAKALLIGGLSAGETAAYLPKERALVFADAVLGGPVGSHGRESLRLACDVWPLADPEAQSKMEDAVRDSLRRLLDLDFAAVLPSHGQLMRSGAKAELTRILGKPR